MALSLISRPRLLRADPTISLNQALKEFDSSLSEDERRRYHSHCSRPDAQTVLNFVSEIDANNRGRGGRCAATRLVTFLNATQRFVVIIDTFVSSNPKIAALIWGGVKTTILVASNVASYFDKITSLIMDIGRSCPAYKSFGELFPDSLDLQTALCEYFATIIKLCMKIIQQLHTPATSLLLRAFVPFDATFKPYQEDLSRIVKSVELQILLASQQAARSERLLSKNERKRNANFQLTFSKIQADSKSGLMQAEKREAINLRTSIRNKLSPVDYVRPWKRLRQQCVHDTTTWIEHDANFLEWTQDSRSSILWCAGNMGAGKTVLVSSIIAHLRTIQKPSDKISYFFCQSEDSLSISTRAIFGCIISQLLDSYLENAECDALNELYKQIQSLDFEDVKDITRIVSEFESGGSNYVILDGLDECEGQDVHKISKLIDALSKNRIMQFKVLCASRIELEDKLFQEASPDHKIILSREIVDMDIERYIEVALHEKLDKGQLTLHDPTLIWKIREVLLQGAQGMFLWTHLLIEEICAQETDHDVSLVLKNPPRQLKDLFYRMKQRVLSSNGAKRAMKAMQFCGIAKRPLTIEELREALTIQRSDTDLDGRRICHNFNRVLSDCGSFLFVDREEQTVHYIHHSARTYLFTNDPEFNENAFHEPSLDKSFGILCMTYLSFNVFRGQLAKTFDSSRAVINPCAITQGTLKNLGNGLDEKAAAKVARRLLRLKDASESRRPKQLKRFFQEALGDTEAARLEAELQNPSFRFLTYARSYWIFHLKELDNSDKECWALFCRCVESLESVDRPWEVDHPDEVYPKIPSEIKHQIKLNFQTTSKGWPEYYPDGDITRLPTKVKWAVQNNHAALLLYSESTPENALSEHERRDLLLYLSWNGQIRLIEFLFDTVKRYREDAGRIIVDELIGGLNGKVHRLLATRGYKVTDGKPYFMQAFESVVHLDYDELVERFLFAAADTYGTIAKYLVVVLERAASRGDVRMVERFLAIAIASNDADVLGLATALEKAARQGHHGVVEMILAFNHHSGTIKAPDLGTALRAAAYGGHLKSVEHLLPEMADVDLKDPAGLTALHIAIAGGHVDCVERLIAAQANCSIDGYHGRTALHFAVRCGVLEILDMVLATKAYVHWRYNPGVTESGVPVQHECLEVAEILGVKARINAPDYRGRTALYLAVASGRLEALECLIAAKADIDQEDSQGQTALHLATKLQFGNLKMLDRLIMVGANVDHRDFEGLTALHLAAKLGRHNTLERLIAAKADVNARDHGLRTALHYGAMKNHVKTIECLLTAKADLEVMDAYKKTAIAYATVAGHEVIADMLSNFKAKNHHDDDDDDDDDDADNTDDDNIDLFIVQPPQTE